jgi:hypothetical protein
MSTGGAMTVLETDLTAESDEVLDAGLVRLYAAHAEADDSERPAIHLAIMEVLGEQSRRLALWRAEHVPTPLP